MVNSSAATAAGAVMASHSSPTPPSSAFATMAASGSSTMTLSHNVATPSPMGPTPPTAVLGARRRAAAGCVMAVSA